MHGTEATRLGDMMSKETRDAHKAAERAAPVTRANVPSEITNLAPAVSTALAAHLSRNNVISLATPTPTLNIYRMLRTQVMNVMHDKGWKTLGVTSCRAGEGKTTAAVNLAAAIAMNPTASALLVDCNLNAAHLHRMLGVQAAPGLTDYLISDLHVDAMVARTPISRLSLVPASGPLLNSAEMLASDRMKQFIEWVKRQSGFSAAIFDLPSVLDSVDALSLTPMLDAVLLVAQERKTRKPDLAQTAQLLSTSNLIGTVLNRASS